MIIKQEKREYDTPNSDKTNVHHNNGIVQLRPHNLLQTKFTDCPTDNLCQSNNAQKRTKAIYVKMTNEGNKPNSVTHKVI